MGNVVRDYALARLFVFELYHADVLEFLFCHINSSIAVRIIVVVCGIRQEVKCEGLCESRRCTDQVLPRHLVEVR